MQHHVDDDDDGRLCPNQTANNNFITVMRLKIHS